MNRKSNVIIIITFIVLLIVLIAVSIASIDNLRTKLNDSRHENYALNEANNDLRDQNDKLIEALKREHLIAIKDDPKLLVANLAWIDTECGTHYLQAISDIYDEQSVDLTKLKDLFDKDEKARKRAVKVIANYTERTDIFTVTEEYYDYLVSDEYDEFRYDKPENSEVDDKTLVPENPS